MPTDKDKAISIKEAMIEKARQSWMNIFIENAKISYLVAAFIFLLGAMAVYQVPKESSPVIDFGIVNVSTVNVGASAFDMDQLVTQEIENEVKDVDGIDKITSNSSNSVSNISIELDPETDVGEAVNDIRAAVDTAKADLPSDAEDPIITKVEGGIEPIFDVNLVGDIHPTLLRDYAHQLQTMLEFDSNVKEVTISGGAEREVFVDLDPAALQQFGLSAGDVSNAIRGTHVDSPIGDLAIDDLEYTLRIAGRHQDAADVRAVVVSVRTGSSGTSVVTVGDVANVYEVDEETDSLIRLSDGVAGTSNAAIKLTVTKGAGIDIFKADPIIREKVQAFVDERFDGTVTVHFTNELMVGVSDSYQTVITSAVQSTIMVIVLLVLFLRAKESFIAALVIPLSFLITIAATNAMGNTLNFMVNFSMILALGILVDIAVVIMEGIHDGIKKGYTPKEAAELTLYEFKTPLISGQLTTLAVFIPLLVLPGILGKYLSYIPVSVFLTLVGALFVSLLLIPGIASTILVSHAEEKKQKRGYVGRQMERFYTWRDGKLDALRGYYQQAIKWCLNRRWYRIGVFYVVSIATFLTFLIPIPFTMFPADDFDFFQVEVELPTGTVKESTLPATQVVEAILLAEPEVELLQTTITNNEANIFVELVDSDDREAAGMRTSIALSEDLREAFKQFQTYEVRINEAETGPPSEAPVATRVIAEDTSKLQAAKQVASDFKAILADIPNTDNIRDDVTDIPGEMTYHIDREAALRLGVDPSSVSTVARAAIDGVTSATITRGEREVDITVRYDQDAMNDFGDFGAVQIPNRDGDLISLSQVLIPEFRSALSEIRRVDRQIAITVSSDLTADGNALEVTQAFQAAIDDYEMPDGISILDAGENAENAELFAALGFGFLIAVILIFSILVIQFNSFSLPGIILFTIIMSLLGVNIGLYLVDIPRSLAFIIGFISLAGIVVNDAIILVDRINKLRTHHESEHRLADIIAHAGASRLQPIMLTTLTTAAGIAPLIFVDTFWAGLSVTIIFGLVVASTLTLFVTPVMYLQMMCEGKVTFAPLGVLAGLAFLVPGIFSGTVVTIVIGAVLVLFFGWQVKRGLKDICEHGADELLAKN